jgi:hypothetical protein
MEVSVIGFLSSLSGSRPVRAPGSDVGLGHGSIPAEKNRERAFELDDHAASA